MTAQQIPQTQIMGTVDKDREGEWIAKIQQNPLKNEKLNDF